MPEAFEEKRKHMTSTQDLIERQAFTAGEIAKQLGGNRFRVMTGASRFTVRNAKLGGLFFRLPGKGGYVKDGINAVEIVLDYNDTYTVEFSRIRGPVQKVISTVDDVYAEDLQPLFTLMTGLVTRL
jgi:hypothetical protein